MKKKDKNLEQEFNEKNCENECDSIKELSNKVAIDSMKILADIRHIMAYLGSISIEIENINTLGHMVTLGCEELDVLYYIYNNHENASKDNSELEEVIASYNLNMVQLDEDMKKLLEKMPKEELDMIQHFATELKLKVIK